MDKGRPFRAPQSKGRSSATGSKPAPVESKATSEPKEPRAAEVQPAGVKSSSTKKSRKQPFNAQYIVVAILAVALIAVAGWFFASSNSKDVSSTIDSDKYQAVFLTNGQVYFGKLEAVDSSYMRLTDVYYLRSQQSALDVTESEDVEEPAAAQADIQLIKLGDELHGPEDEMIISKDQMLFYENLKPNGRVSELISTN